jgi:integrase
VLSSVSAMFAWAMRAGVAQHNPASLVPKHSETVKTRVLSDEELRLIWRATAGLTDYDRIVRLALLTGCRRVEIGGLRWSEINDHLITLPERRTKTGIVHEVLLSQLAMAQLPLQRAGQDGVFGRAQTGFSGWSRSKRRLDGRIAHMRLIDSGGRETDEDLADFMLPPWGLHDFRRTLSTRLNEAGVDPHVVEAVLGHAGAKRGVAGIYNRASYRSQKAQALTLWTDTLAKIFEDVG